LFGRAAADQNAAIALENRRHNLDHEAIVQPFTCFPVPWVSTCTIIVRDTPRGSPIRPRFPAGVLRLDSNG
jgi:hypothetical protein